MKSFSTIIILLLLPLSLFCWPIEFEYFADSTTTWGGEILSDTTWTADKSPYVIRGDIVVDTGVTWTIEPGCELWFDPTYYLWPSIECWGRLIAEGIATDSIFFMAHPGAPLTWDYGFRRVAAWETAHDTSSFSYCRFSEAIVCLVASGSSVSVNNCRFIRGRTPGGAPYTPWAFSCIGGNAKLDECEFVELEVRVTDEAKAEVRGCVFNGNGLYGIYCETNVGIIENNLLIETAIYFSDSSYRRTVLLEDSIIIQNNLILANQPNGVGISAGGLLSATLILNNTVLFSRYGNIISSWNWHPEILINNNISCFSGSTGIRQTDSGFPATLRYNNSFRNVNNFLHPLPAIGVMCTVNVNGDSCDAFFNISADPMFVDTASGDYHLQSSSPCIDAGDPSLPWDPDSTPPDIGCFYFDQTAIKELPSIPRIFEFSAYPNPFNSSCKIAFALPAEELSMFTKIEIYDINGRIVSSVIEPVEMTGGTKLPSTSSGSGLCEFVWTPDESVPSGVYFAVLRVGTWAGKAKITLIR